MNHVQNEETVNRTIFGIAAHFIGFLSGVFGTGLLYGLSSNEFTKSNALEAVNWQLSFLFYLLILLGIFFLTSIDIIALIAGFLIFGLFAVDLIFCLSATVKAVYGTTWTYPLSLEVL